MEDIACCTCNDVLCGDGGHCYCHWKPGECVCNAFSFCFCDPSLVALVCVKCGSYIPSFDGMWGPCHPFTWFFMDEYFDSWWCYGCFVEAIVSVDLCPCREVGVYSGSAHEIEH